jgi:hypothetical protein
MLTIAITPTLSFVPAAWLVQLAQTVLAPAVWLLQAVAPELPIPGWLIGALPVIAFGLTELIVRMGGSLSGDQKRALYRAVCLTIVGGLVLFGQAPVPFDLPATPANPLDPDAVGAFVAALLAYGGAVFTWAWGGGKTLHDLLDAAGLKA